MSKEEEFINIAKKAKQPEKTCIPTICEALSELNAQFIKVQFASQNETLKHLYNLRNDMAEILLQDPTRLEKYTKKSKKIAEIIKGALKKQNEPSELKKLQEFCRKKATEQNEAKFGYYTAIASQTEQPLATQIKEINIILGPLNQQLIEIDKKNKKAKEEKLEQEIDALNSMRLNLIKLRDRMAKILRENIELENNSRVAIFERKVTKKKLFDNYTKTSEKTASMIKDILSDQLSLEGKGKAINQWDQEISTLRLNGDTDLSKILFSILTIVINTLLTTMMFSIFFSFIGMGVGSVVSLPGMTVGFFAGFILGLTMGIGYGLLVGNGMAKEISQGEYISLPFLKAFPLYTKDCWQEDISTQRDLRSIYSPFWNCNEQSLRENFKESAGAVVGALPSLQEN